MKLTNFLEDESLNQLRYLMNAPMLEVFNQTTIYQNNIDEIRTLLSGTGIELHFSEINQCEDKTFEYHGQKVLVYIRDQRTGYNNGYKFHISNCSTLQSYINRNAIDRYVISNRTDNKFNVNVIGLNGKIERKMELVEMNVCKNCLETLCYDGYSGHSYTSSQRIYNQFSLTDFFNKYKSTNHTILPSYNSDNSPVQIYTKDFENISRELRASKNWICQKCFVDFSYSKDKLHVHHKNGIVTDNSETNLEVLCKSCHQTKHNHLIN